MNGEKMKQKVNRHLKTVLQNTEGYMTFEEMELLYKCAMQSELPIVEIGAYQGRSTVVLGIGASEGKDAMVYSIDHHPSYTDGGKQFGYQDKRPLIDNLVKFELIRKVDIINIPSYGVNVCKVFPEGIGLLFIDGKHDYQSVMQDYIRFGSSVKGDILFHDFTWEGPRKVIKEFGLKVVESAGNLARTEL